MGPERAPRDEHDPVARARAFVVNSLAAKAQSVAEIGAKLSARGTPPEVADGVITEAQRLGYLDDTELAGQLARGFRERGFGRRRAAAALRRRQVGEAAAADALGAAFDDVEEWNLADAALGSRPTQDASDRRRAVAFLVRRGFSSGVAWQVVRARHGRER